MRSLMFILILAIVPAVLSAQSRKDSLDMVFRDAAASMDSIVTGYNESAEAAFNEYL